MYELRAVLRAKCESLATSKSQNIHWKVPAIRNRDGGSNQGPGVFLIKREMSMRQRAIQKTKLVLGILWSTYVYGAD